MLVAEALQRMPDPLEAVLASPAPVSAGAVRSAIAHALLPPLATDDPPAWLRPGQVTSFRRTVAAARCHGGVLLAEPVGTGKTWIALAAAGKLAAAPPVVLAPAVLLTQWERVLESTGVAAELISHETLSRGRLPHSDPRCVIIDESHWFRVASTRRYEALAPWLCGRVGILVSATPVVNRPLDVANQLRLFLRDDALAAGGLPSLRSLGEARGQADALGEVIVAGWAETAERPTLRRTSERAHLDRRMGRLLRELDRLGLSTDPAIAALVRTSLWGAAASSPAALAAALLRYLVLLDHAADATRSGHPLARDAIRRFLAPDPSQLVLWSLLPAEPGAPIDLMPADRPRVAALRAQAAALVGQADPKAARLRELLRDGRRTVIFTSAVATVGYLRTMLEPAPVAWCTGAAAGIGATRMPREAVLAWFGPSPPAAPDGMGMPSILVATDVVAEGLDLQGAERVVHYDLPWTVVRTEQRTGRVRRMAARHAEVSEHWILPPRGLARRLRVEPLLARKGLLPGTLGVGEENTAPWRRRHAAARQALDGEPLEGYAIATVPHQMAHDALACVRLEIGDGRGATRLFVHHRRHGWRADDRAGLELFHHLGAATAAPGAQPVQAARLVEALAPEVRQALRHAAGLSWAPGWIGPGTAAVLRRLRHWARIAARAHDARLLSRLDGAVRGLGRGLTAGEELAIARLAARTDASLHEHLRVLPAAAPLRPLPVVRLVGLVVIVAP